MELVSVTTLKISEMLVLCIAPIWNRLSSAARVYLRWERNCYTLWVSTRTALLPFLLPVQ